MKENKLGTYLTSFTEKDWPAYTKYYKSLYGLNSDYQLIMTYIKSHKSQYDPSYMDTEYLRKKIRPSASKQVFAKVITNLCKYIEQYMTWAEVESDVMMKDTLLLQALGKRGLTKQFYKHKEKSKTKREELPKGLWQNYHAFMAEYLLYYCNMTTDIKVSKVALENSFLNLDKFNSVIYGYINVEMHNRTVLLKEDWSSLLSTKKDVINYLNFPESIFDNLIQLKYTKSKKYYNLLKVKLQNEQLSTNISYTIIIHLTSYLNGSIVRGENTLGLELLNLYKYGIDKNILFPNGRIPILRYINILLLACGVKEFKWATIFVKTYSKLVGKELESSAINLGKAHIEFNLKKFENVIILLRDNKYRDFEFEIRAKWLILSSNYEINKLNFESVQYYVNSFIYYVKRNKHKTTSQGAISYLKSAKFLLQVAISNNPEQIFNNIKKESHLLYRKWLLEKIKEKLK